MYTPKKHNHTHTNSRGAFKANNQEPETSDALFNSVWPPPEEKCVRGTSSRNLPEVPPIIFVLHW